MSEQELAAIEARANAAIVEVVGLANGSRKWTMCVPVQRDTDSDMVLSAPIEDVRTLVAEVRRLRAELDVVNEARLCCYDVHRRLHRAVAEHCAVGHDQGATLAVVLAETAGGEEWASEIDRVRADNDRLRAVVDASEALFRLKDTGTTDDLYRAWREMGAQLAFARGQIPLGSDADLGRTR